MKIGIDLDGCLADFNTSFIRKVVIVTGRNLFPEGYAPTEWNYPETLGYTRDEVSKVWNVIKSNRNFWARLDCYHGEKVVQALDLLNTRQAYGDEVYFITSRVGYKAKEQSEAWLRYHGMAHPTVLISSEKGLCALALKLDAYIDDNVDNVMAMRVQAPNCKGFLCSRPWTVGMNVPGVTRMPSVWAMLQAVLSPRPPAPNAHSEPDSTALPTYPINPHGLAQNSIAESTASPARAVSTVV